MRLFSRPTGKSPASVTPLPAAPAEAAATVTRRIEITVEREWTEVVVRSGGAPAIAEESPVQETGAPEDKLTSGPVPEIELPNARLQLPRTKFEHRSPVMKSTSLSLCKRVLGLFLSQGRATSARGLVTPQRIVLALILLLAGTWQQAGAQSVTLQAATPGEVFLSYPGGYSTNQNIAFVNTGPTDTVNLSSVTVAGNGAAANSFLVNNNYCFGGNKAPGGGCNVQIQFSAGALGTGNYTGTVTANYTDGANTLTKTLTLNATVMAYPTPAGVPQLAFVPGVTTIAGTGSNYSANGVPALTAVLRNPQDVLPDKNGNIFIADTGESSVRVVYAGGTLPNISNPVVGNIYTFAGTLGTPGYTGDGSAANAATLSGPAGLAFDSAGNLYIADTGNFRIRKVDMTTGVISTIVGNSSFPISGFSGDGGPATAAELNAPYGLAFDSNNNLYISDYKENVVRVVYAAGTLPNISSPVVGDIYSYAGIGGGPNVVGSPGFGGDGGAANAAQIWFPYYIALDASNNLYIADFDNGRIRKVNGSTGKISTIAGAGTYGGGTSTSEGFSPLVASIDPVGVTVDPLGNLYASDFNGEVYESNTSGVIDWYPSTATTFNIPGNIHLDSAGDLYVADQYNNRIAKIGPAGYLTFGSVNIGSTSSAMLLTLQNNGSGPLTFNATPYTVAGNFAVGNSGTCNFGTSSPLAVGATCTVAVTFSPLNPGALTGSITFSYGTATLVANMTGTGAGSPSIVTASPSSLDFGTELWNHTTSPLYVTLTNTSNYYTATLGTIASTDNDFSVSANSCGTTLLPGGTCQLSATFDPQTYANQSYSGTGSIQATSSAPGSTAATVSFSLSGNGITYPAGVSATPTSIAFGNQTEYTQSNPQTVYVLNQSGATANFTGTTISGPFRIYQDGCSFGIQNNYQCTYLVSFYPTTVGAGQTGTLTIPFTGASGSPLTVTLTGNGTAGTPLETLFPSQVNFGTTAVGTPPLVTPVTETVTVSNNSTAPFSNIAISITGTNAADFSETDNCAANSPILPNGISTCTITISFLPSAAGARNATLNVSSNATNSPQSVALTGAGVASAAQLQFTPAQLNLIAGSGAACGSTITTTTATSATLCNINNAAQDYLGNTYLVDTNYNVVYKVDTTGNLSVFAGTPSLTGGYGGDSGPATSATLSGPTAVAADAFGNIFISDSGNSVVREVSGGTITTYINNAICNGKSPSPGPTPLIAVPIGHSVTTCTTKFHPQGLVFDRSGNLYVADPQSDVVYEVPASQNYNTKTVAGIYGQAGYNGDSIQATTAQLNGPQDVAVDTAGNLYIADTLNYRVRKVDTSGNITTYAGYGAQGNNEDGYPASVAEITPAGVATNLAGDVYISSGAGGIVRKVDTTGFISTIAGRGTGPIGGPATTAAITNAFLSRVDNNGDVLIPTGLQLLAVGPDGILQFGSQAVNVASNPLTVVLEDTGNGQLSFGTTIATVGGNNPGDFTFGSFCGYNLMAGKTCSFGVTFTPGGTGLRTAYLSVPTNTAGTPQIVLLQGNGTGASAPTATLSNIAFGNQPEGTTSAIMYATLTNTSTTSPLTIGTISITGTNSASFALATGNGGACGSTLAANTSCTIAVTFSPPGVQVGYTATLNVATNATGSPQTGTLTGTGTYVKPTVMLTPSPYSFGSVTVNQKSAAQVFTLTNTSTAPFPFTQSVSDSTNFAITGTTCGATLNAGGNCTITVIFQPQSVAPFSASLTVTDSGDSVTVSDSISGTGVAAAAPVASLTSTIAFPNTTQGVTSASLTATLSNTGNATLNITSVVLGGANAADFALVTSTNPCGATLAAGASCLIAATFTPQGTSTYSATITVTDNSATPTQITTLSGTGTAISGADFSIASNTPTETVFGGNPATYSITITPIGGSFTGTVVLGTAGLPSGSTATFTPPSFAPGSSPTSSSLVITTIPQQARLEHRAPWLPPAVTVALLVPLLWWRRRKPFHPMRLSILLLAAILGGAIVTLSGCTGGLQLPSNTYTLSVSGTSGNISHTTTVTLTVQ